MILIFDGNVLWTKNINFLINFIILYILFLKQILYIRDQQLQITDWRRNCDFRQKNQESIDDSRRLQHLMIFASSSGKELDYSTIIIII